MKWIRVEKLSWNIGTKGSKQITTTPIFTTPAVTNHKAVLTLLGCVWSAFWRNPGANTVCIWFPVCGRATDRRTDRQTERRRELPTEQMHVGHSELRTDECDAWLLNDPTIRLLGGVPASCSLEKSELSISFSISLSLSFYLPLSLPLSFSLSFSLFLSLSLPLSLSFAFLSPPSQRAKGKNLSENSEKWVAFTFHWPARICCLQIFLFLWLSSYETWSAFLGMCLCVLGFIIII